MKALLITLLILVPTSVFAYNDDSLKIYLDKSNIISQFNNGTILYNYSHPSQDSKLWSDTIQALSSNAGQIQCRNGLYKINSTLTLPNGISIHGDTVDEHYKNNRGCYLLFNNASNFTLSRFNDIENVIFDFQQKQEFSKNFVINGSNNVINNDWILANNSVSLYMKTCFNNAIGNVWISGGSTGLRLENCTQNEFENIHFTNYKVNGLVFNGSDHNHFNYIQFASPHGGSSTSINDVIFGLSKNDLTYANTFDFLTVVVYDTNFVVNNSNNTRPNLIHVLGIDGTLHSIYYQGGSGNIVYDHSTCPTCNGH